MTGKRTSRAIALDVAVIACGTLMPSFVHCLLPVHGSAMDPSAFHAAFWPNTINVTLWGLHAIPLIIVSYVLLYSLPKERKEKGQKTVPKAGVVGAFLLLLAFMLVLNVSVQTPPSSSTESIAYFLLPITGLVVACLGFLCGMGVAALMRRADDR